ncbi:MAG: thermonuclease family protein [Dehalococcoidia bacterium]
MFFRTQRHGLIVKLGLVLVCLLSAITACGPSTDTVAVLRVIDGDTIVVSGDLRVRYIGINAPEMDEYFGRQAWQANRRLVEGKRVRLEKDISNTDRYGRLLRYVWVDGLLVEAELVREGYARARAYPPDVKYQGKLEALQREAREVGRGIWAKR